MLYSIVFADQNSSRSAFLVSPAPRTPHFRPRAENPVTTTHLYSYPCGLIHSSYTATPLFATLTETAGVYSNSSHSGTWRADSLLTHFVSHSCELPCTSRKLNSCIFKQLRTPSQKHPGWGYPLHSLLGKQKELGRSRLQLDRYLVTPFSSTSQFSSILLPSRPDATIPCSTVPAMTIENQSHRPRVGIPWRTSTEEREKTREKLDYYFQAVRKAGAEPEEISLVQPPEQLDQQLKNLDGFVLPGSPADVDPALYGEARHIKTNTLDPNRDNTDSVILDHAFKSSKPVLAICYGCQILNVHLHGSLIQDIRSQKPDSAPHGSTDLPPGSKKGDIQQEANLESHSRLAQLNQGLHAQINSSHHQAIDKPGKNLRVTAHATDGIIEGVEWTGDSNWVVGVQWHPERMPGDAFADRLFTDFVAAARSARAASLQRT
jgi:putative glutamine amidotransferase